LLDALSGLRVVHEHHSHSRYLIKQFFKKYNALIDFDSEIPNDDETNRNAAILALLNKIPMEPLNTVEKVN
jgi:beta-lactamase class D